MGVTLVRLRPDMSRLLQVAASRGFLPPGQDLGYALHAALTAAFGSGAPRPFRLLRTGLGGELLGYCAASGAELEATASLPAVGEMADLAGALRPQTLEVKAMPASWPNGLRLGFEIRVRPVVRIRPEGRDGRHHEIDVHDHRCREGGTEGEAGREVAYAGWLKERLERDGAVAVEAVSLVRYRALPVLRRPFDGERRRAAVALGPDAILAGVLRVMDGDGLNRLLTSGVGRHKGFGFGMLLLRPG
jgi:CRISPR system Cascade subunit CasE